MAETPGKPSREQLSKTPSWVMLGFVLGCVFAFTIKHELQALDEVAEARRANAPRPASSSAPLPAPPANTVTAMKDRPSLAAIEDIFIEHNASAVWELDLTEVALWNEATGKYSDFFEILRSDGNFYFRIIPRLTRPVIDPEQNRLKAILFTGPSAKSTLGPR